jgi:glutathione S-transferase
MQLYLNNASPYARLVFAVAYEKQLEDRIELIWTDPWASGSALIAANPLAKVPVLIAEDGQPLIESACICDYLDTIGSGPRLMPIDGAARLAALRKSGLGRGLIDVSFGAVIQKRYGSAAEGVLEKRWREAAARCVPMLENLPTLQSEPDLGDLSVAVALSYLDLRLPDIGWRTGAPRLTKWFEVVSARESLSKTAPA